MNSCQYHVERENSGNYVFKSSVMSNKFTISIDIILQKPRNISGNSCCELKATKNSVNHYIPKMF